MDRRRHRAGGAAAWQILRHRRTADAQPRPPSRPGARRRRLADAAVAAARQQRRARCGGRGSTSISAITRSRARGCARPPLLASSHAVYGVTHLASLARLLPERDPHEDIYEMLDRTLDDFDDVGEAAAHLIRFELAMLAELGFGLDLENCAATGETTELIYVSPKSGGAVSRQAGEPWRDRLLRLPAVPARRRGRGERLVGPGPAGRFSADRAVPAAPRAGAARAGPFRRPGRVYQRGDEKSGANQFVGLTRLLSRRPCERRDPYAAAIDWRCGPSHFSPQTPVVMGPCVRRDDGCSHSRLARFSRKV